MRRVKKSIKGLALVSILIFIYVGVVFGEEKTNLQILKCYNFSGYKNKEFRKYIDFVWNRWVSEVYKDETSRTLQEEIQKGKITKEKNVKVFTADINGDGVEDIFYYILDSFCFRSSCRFSVLLSSKDGYKGVAEGDIVHQITIDTNSGRTIHPICILNSSTNGLMDLLIEGKIVLKAYRFYRAYSLHEVGENPNIIKKRIESCYKFIDYSGQENLKEYVNLVLNRWKADILEDFKSWDEEKRSEVLRDLGVSSVDEYIQKRIMKEKGILKLLFTDINNDGKEDIFYFIFSPMIGGCNGKGECVFNVILSSEKGFFEKIDTNLISHVKHISRDKLCVLNTSTSGLKDLLLQSKPFSFVLKAQWQYKANRSYKSINEEK